MKKIIIKNNAGETIKEIDQDVKKILIKQMTDQGIDVMSACHHGICGACIFSIEKGHDNINKSFKGEPGFPLGEDEVMTCIAGTNDLEGDIILKSNS